MIWPAPADFLNGYLTAPEDWEKSGIVMFFNLECPACVSRGVPLMKRYQVQYQDVHFLLIHTSFGHKLYARDEVMPTLEKFVFNFARIPFSVALDLEGTLAEQYQIQGTPHWLVFASGGVLLRSIFGSQENAQTRLEYLLEELAQTSDEA